NERHSICIYWAHKLRPGKKGRAQSLTRCGARFSVAGGRNRPSARHLSAGPWSLGFTFRARFGGARNVNQTLTGPANRVVSKTVGGQGFWLIEVAAIEDDRFAHQPVHQFKIRMPELLPLGDNGDAVGPFEGAV